MLTVRNLPPEPTAKDWIAQERGTIKGLSLGAITIFCVAALLDTSDDRWARYATADGVLVITEFSSRAECVAALQNEDETCQQITGQGVLYASRFGP